LVGMKTVKNTMKTIMKTEYLMDTVLLGVRMVVREKRKYISMVSVGIELITWRVNIWIHQI